MWSSTQTRCVTYRWLWSELVSCDSHVLQSLGEVLLVDATVVRHVPFATLVHIQTAHWECVRVCVCVHDDMHMQLLQHSHMQHLWSLSDNVLHSSMRLSTLGEYPLLLLSGHLPHFPLPPTSPPPFPTLYFLFPSLLSSSLPPLHLHISAPSSPSAHSLPPPTHLHI